MGGDFTKASKCSVFSGPEEDGTAHQLCFLGGLKSADLEGGFKMFQTIFSAPEKSEYNI